jgi:hypothetical protein
MLTSHTKTYPASSIGKGTFLPITLEFFFALESMFWQGLHSSHQIGASASHHGTDESEVKVNCKHFMKFKITCVQGDTRVPSSEVYTGKCQISARNCYQAERVLVLGMSFLCYLFCISVLHLIIYLCFEAHLRIPFQLLAGRSCRCWRLWSFDSELEPLMVGKPFFLVNCTMLCIVVTWKPPEDGMLR